MDYVEKTLFLEQLRKEAVILGKFLEATGEAINGYNQALKSNAFLISVCALDGLLTKETLEGENNLKRIFDLMNQLVDEMGDRLLLVQKVIKEGQQDLYLKENREN